MVRQELKKVNESNDKLSSEIKVCVSQMEMLRNSTKDNYDKLAMQFTQDEEIIKRVRYMHE